MPKCWPTRGSLMEIATIIRFAYIGAMPTNESLYLYFFFFFNDTATTEIYTLSLHDALPILPAPRRCLAPHRHPERHRRFRDRKSTRLNSSHQIISYAVFCLKKKKKKKN